MLESTPCDTPENQSDSLQHTLTVLADSDCTRCAFQHENPLSQCAPRCPKDVSARRLGCAHGASNLLNIVSTAEELGIATAEEVRQWQSDFVSDQRELGAADYTASKAYLYEDTLPRTVLETQKNVIHRRQALVDEIRQRIVEFTAGSPPPLHETHPRAKAG